MGNYWSRYIIKNPDAQDADNDGIWDEPYYIYGLWGHPPTTQDKYPVVEPIDIENININIAIDLSGCSQNSQQSQSNPSGSSQQLSSSLSQILGSSGYQTGN